MKRVTRSDAARQTLDQALCLARLGHSRRLGQALNILHGVPLGGWSETRQAYSTLGELLPARSARAYTIEQFVEAAYSIRDGRYRTGRSMSNVVEITCNPELERGWTDLFGSSEGSRCRMRAVRQVEQRHLETGQRVRLLSADGHCLYECES